MTKQITQPVQWPRFLKEGSHLTVTKIEIKLCPVTDQLVTTVHFLIDNGETLSPGSLEGQKFLNTIVDWERVE